jgi:hypothetical protein
MRACCSVSMLLPVPLPVLLCARVLIVMCGEWSGDPPPSSLHTGEESWGGVNECDSCDCDCFCVGGERREATASWLRRVKDPGGGTVTWWMGLDLEDLKRQGSFLVKLIVSSLSRAVLTHTVQSHREPNSRVSVTFTNATITIKARLAGDKINVRNIRAKMTTCLDATFWAKKRWPFKNLTSRNG